MTIESKTAQESWMVATAAQIENYKKSFDAMISFILKEINRAAAAGEFSVKIKISALEKFINNSDFESIAQDVERILTNGYIIGDVKSSNRSSSYNVEGLGYTIEKSGTYWNIQWDKPMYSTLDINLPYPNMGNGNILQ